MPEQEAYVTLPLLTIADTAKYLGVSKRIVYQLIEWGEIKAVRVDGSAMLEKKSLDDYRESGKLT